MSEEPEKEEIKPFIICLDTNVWVSQLMFRNPLGAALLFIISQTKGLIALPEIIQEEIIKNINTTGRDAIDNINSNYNKIDTIIGKKFKRYLPSESEISFAIGSKLLDLSNLIMHIPFMLEHAKKALKRVNSGLPPNGPKNQQFKDSAIWEALIGINSSNSIYFVTEDKGFFENKDLNKGLAKNLLEECIKHRIDIKIFSNLAICLDSIRDQTDIKPLDNIKIGLKIGNEIKQIIDKNNEEKNYEVLEQLNTLLLPFLTEKINVLALQFELKYKLGNILDKYDNERNEPSYTVKGNCFYQMDLESVYKISIDYEEWQWFDANGDSQKVATHHFRGSVSIFDPPWTDFEFREPID